jgi:hypothetical protein
MQYGVQASGCHRLSVDCVDRVLSHVISRVPHTCSFSYSILDNCKGAIPPGMSCMCRISASVGGGGCHLSTSHFSCGTEEDIRGMCVLFCNARMNRAWPGIWEPAASVLGNRFLGRSGKCGSVAASGLLRASNDFQVGRSFRQLLKTSM